MRIFKANRLKKTAVLTDKPYWCRGCDANKVACGGKCDVCGHSEKRVTKHMSFTRANTQIEL